MNQNMYDTTALQNLIKQQFNVALTVAEIVVVAPVAMAAQATVFRTSGGQVYVYISSQSSQVLDDMLKIVRRMNCQPDHIYPPHGDTEYFDRIAREKFKAMFPGKHITGEDDLRYYKNITPYNPALISVAKVKGEIYGFDPESKQWRKVKDYSYRFLFITHGTR